MRKVTKRHYRRIHQVFNWWADAFNVFVRLIAILAVCTACFEHDYSRIWAVVPIAIIYWTPISDTIKKWCWEIVATDIEVIN